MILPSNILRVLVLYIIIIQTKTFGQVCVETKMEYRDVPETYLYTYMEAYEKSNCLFWCTSTRVATAMGTRTVQKLMPVQVNVCCEGYIQDENDTENSIHCKPYCSPSCENGYCKSPGVCACKPGYIPDLFESHSCSPLCITKCNHGACIAPNTCQCDPGYENVDGVCKPICSDSCLNGTCVAPETCQCLPGYIKSEDDICEPFCSSYSASGDCIYTITCEPGWIKVIKGVTEICEPVCSEPCVNGICIAPETCECLNGYVESVNDTYVCEPYCHFGCEHGSCISPHTCVCDPGWYKKEASGTCLAHCDHKCGNGTCVAPNICECFPGYEVGLFLDEIESRCVPICNNCEGTCVAPDVCMCEPHQEMALVTADGQPCDCVENCSNVANKCEKTICLSTATTTTTATVKRVFKDDNYETLEDATVSSIITTTDANDDRVDDDNSVEGVHIDHKEFKIETATWYNSSWCYVTGSVLILIILTLIAAAIMKKKSFNRNIFHAHENEVTTDVHNVHYKQNTK